MLDICSINKTFNPGTINANHALKDLSLHLADGESIAVIGGNGAGKSTLLNAVAGVWKVDSGSIRLGGIDITRLPEYKRAKYIGRVFQDPMMGTAANMQIEENLALAARRGKHRTLLPGITKAEREQFRDMLRILDLGLENRLTDKVGLLSGGQRQALTRTLVNQDQLTTLMITHNMRDAIEYGDRLIMMYEGRIALDIAGQEKKNLTVEDLLAKFGQATGSSETTDKLLLS